MKYFMILASVFMLVACGNEDNSSTKSDNVLTEDGASVRFQNIDVKVDSYEFVLTGEASGIVNEFFYVIDQGEERLLDEKSIPLDASTGDWGAFEINETIPESAVVSEDPPIITLYGKDNNNEMVNPNYIPVDLGD
ncbi:hypothetical protein ACFOUV_11845 [Oceanobacillus longus]|uniref:Uncharacterized protein n=1 Tax=Oceanobacillus longus TaxID=930120 RepID=A0ABV8GY37_9BACI